MEMKIIESGEHENIQLEELLNFLASQVSLCDGTATSNSFEFNYQGKKYCALLKVAETWEGIEDIDISDENVEY